MTILIYAVTAVLCAQIAHAEQRENKPFNTVNGRTTTAAPAGARLFTKNTPGGGAATNAPAAAQAPEVTAAMINGAPSDGGRAFLGGGRPMPSRTETGRAARRGGRAFNTEEAPPNFSKPGAWIRTTGQLPKYEKVENAPTHTTDAGEIIMDKNRAVDVGRAPSLQRGPKDTLPPPNPGTGRAGGTGGAAANSAGGGNDAF